MKKFKRHFSGPSNPSNPSNPSHQTRRFAPRRKGFHWTPEGHCGCLVENWFKITPCKSEFLEQKTKSHLPAVIFKFLTMTPNLTSNFEICTRNSGFRREFANKFPTGKGIYWSNSRLKPEFLTIFFLHFKVIWKTYTFF